MYIILGADERDALLDVVALLDFIDHANRIVGVADDALALAVQRELFAAEDVLARALAVSLEVTSWADVLPTDILALSELGELLDLRSGERLELLWEIRRVDDLHRMLGVHIERACAADDDEARLRAREDVAEMRKRRGVLRQELRLPRAERIDDSIEALEVVRRKVEDILDDELLRVRFVLPADKCRDIHPSTKRLRDDLACDATICCYNCDFHDVCSLSV